jgi:hypothetical protein
VSGDVIIVDTVVVGWKIRGFFSVRAGGTIYTMCQETGNLRHYTIFDCELSEHSIGHVRVTGLKQ